MGFLIAIIVGALVGWIASKIMRTDPEQGALANIIIGIIGAFLAQLIFGSLLGIGSAAATGSFSFWGIIWGVVGSVILIGILKLAGVLK